MKFYIYIFIHILLIIYLLKSTSSQDRGNRKKWRTNRNSSSSCLPSCANKLEKHCNKFEIQLRATMAKCSRVVSPFASTTPKNDDDFTPSVCEGINCGKKLHATLKIINQGETATVNQYIIIDHVIDSVTGQRVSLLNPYVVVLKQKPLLQMYGLKYKNVVNAEAKEQVINKKDPAFTGCDDISDNPTCGNMRYNGDVIPFSQGFCCSCDEKKNVRRQPRSLDISREKGNLTVNVQGLIYNYLKWDESDINSENQKEFTREKRSVESKDFNDYRSSIRLRGKSPIIYVTPKLMDKFSRNSDIFMNSLDKKYESKDANFESSKSHVVNREQHNIQIRGGQKCDDEWVPQAKANFNSYHDSAHCLRFSSLWYAMYKLSEPVLDHSLFIKIFQKREGDDCNTEWVDLTSKKTINVGTLNPKYEDCNMLVTYDSCQPGGDPLPFALDPKQKNVLIPQEVPLGVCKHPECAEGAREYLVVDTNSIQPSGEQCDTAGVGYAAFYHQPQRCSVRRGSCLRNQPSQLWRRDKMSCKEGQRGKYFLKNYAGVPDDAVRQTRKGDSKYLALQYSEPFKSTVDIEVKADDNIVFRSLPLAKVTEVYVDSSSATATILTIKIHNNGLISNVFHARLTDCPLELPVDWGNLEADPVVIPPQHHTVFTLRLLGILPVDKFYCSIEALTSKNEILAVRRIRIVKSDRCICSWHCLCACYLTNGLGCEIMSTEHYKAAGFIGSMPLSTTMVKVSYYENAMFGFIFFVLLLVIILLLMGLTKALIGFCFFVPIGIWGLDMIIGVNRMSKYYEDELVNREVIYDEDGWPIHPDTKRRNVRIADEKMEFCLNIIFFFTYPVTLLILLFSRICCPYYTYCDEEDKGEYFESVNTIAYTKCPESKRMSSGSDCGNEDMFEFEDDDISNDD